MPRFKSKHRSRLRCRFSTGAIGLSADRRHVRLPVIGAVRRRVDPHARKLEAGVARIRSATLSWQRGRWHVSFSVELPDVEPAPREGGRVVGVDLGITELAVLSTGERVPNPRRLDRASAPTTRSLSKTCTSRACSATTGWPGASPTRTGRRSAANSPTRPSAPGCGAAKAKLTLSQRTYECMTCGIVLDRDVNAARNLAALAADTGELRREQPDRTDVRPPQPAAVAIGPLREESNTTQRHHREAVAR